MIRARPGTVGRLRGQEERLLVEPGDDPGVDQPVDARLPADAAGAEYGRPAAGYAASQPVHGGYDFGSHGMSFLLPCASGTTAPRLRKG